MRRRTPESPPEAAALLDAPPQRMSFALLYARRLARWLHTKDMYMIYAALAVVAYVLCVNVAAHAMEAHLVHAARTAQAGNTCPSLFTNTTTTSNNNTTTTTLKEYKDKDRPGDMHAAATRWANHKAVFFAAASRYLTDALERSAQLLHHAVRLEDTNTHNTTGNPRDPPVASLRSLLWESRALQVWFTLALRPHTKSLFRLGHDDVAARLRPSLAQAKTSLEELVAYLNASEAEAAALRCSSRDLQEEGNGSYSDRLRVAECRAAAQTRRMWCGVLQLVSQEDDTSAMASCAARMAALGVHVKEGSCAYSVLPSAHTVNGDAQTMGTLAHDVLQAERTLLWCNGTAEDNTRRKAALLTEWLARPPFRQLFTDSSPATSPQTTTATTTTTNNSSSNNSTVDELPYVRGAFAPQYAPHRPLHLLPSRLHQAALSSPSHSADDAKDEEAGETVRQSAWGQSGLFAVSENEWQSYALLLRALTLQQQNTKSNNHTSTALYVAYDKAIEHILSHLIRSSPVLDDNEKNTAKEGRVRYVTFATYRAGSVSTLPILHPSSCALPALLARGLRLGAHRYPNRQARTSRFAEDDILRVAEMLAASCRALYVNAQLRSPLYVTMNATWPRLLPTESRAKPPRTMCDVPTVLLRSYYELYASTHDVMYLRWSLRLMQPRPHCEEAAAGQCGVQTVAQLRSPLVWRNYLAQLRLLVLLLVRYECVEWASQRYAACAEMDGRHGAVRGDTLWDMV